MSATHESLRKTDFINKIAQAVSLIPRAESFYDVKYSQLLCQKYFEAVWMWNLQLDIYIGSNIKIHIVFDLIICS